MSKSSILVNSGENCVTSRIHTIISQGLKLCIKLSPPNPLTVPNDQNTILLTHGLTYSSHEFDLDYMDYSLVKFLSQKGFYVWTFDVGGYGNSERPVNGWVINSEYASQDIACVVDYICNISKISQLNLMGWSWSTITTSTYSENYPEHVRRLILYAPFYKFIKGEVPQNDWHYFDPAQPRADFQINPFTGELDYNITDPEVVNLWDANCRIFDGVKSPNGGRKDLLTRDIQFNPQKLRMPVLLLAGSKDPYLANVNLEYLYQLLPNDKSEIVVLNGGSHMIMIEKPYYRIFQNVIYKFLTGID